MNRVYLSLGSNIDPENNLRSAIAELSRIGRILAISSVWETEPIGFQEQNNYLNSVLALGTDCNLNELIRREIPAIEASLGRRRGKDKFGPRSIDIDVLLFNDLITEIDGRKIPSPEIITRAFVAIPLAEIAPDERHPEIQIPFSEIATKFKVDPRSMHLRHDIHFDLS